MNVLLAMDFSRGATVASAWLACVSWSAGTQVEALHVSAAQRTGVRGLLWRTRTEAASEEVAALARTLSSRLGPAVAVHSSTRAGDPGTAIVERAAEIRADLVVLGSRGRGHVVGNLLGSVSAAVASNAYCSVLVVRRETLRSLLLADDGSDGAHIAARTVLAWSFLARIPTAITNIVDMHESDPAIVDRATNAARSSAPVNGAHRRAAVAVDRRVAEFHAAGRMAIGHVRHGEPSVEILRAARGAGTDLIVVGESNDRPGGSSPLGGVARSVLSGFHGSVLIARAADQVTPGYPVSAGTQSAWSSSTTAGSATIALRSCPVRSDARRQRL